MANNGDTDREFMVGKQPVRGLGSYHKTLPHDEFGEVCEEAFCKLVDASRGDGRGFSQVDGGSANAAPLTNPQGGLAHDQLTRNPAAYDMPPAPTVLSDSTAAEMTELYWMALMRDVSFNGFEQDARAKAAAKELNEYFGKATGDKKDPGRLVAGVDLPGGLGKPLPIKEENLFRVGLPGEDIGPLLSQFFVRDAVFGTQSIDQRQHPYAKGKDYLTSYEDWICAQNTGQDGNGQDYRMSNEFSDEFFEKECRYISTMRDLARFVNKDALHQAYFNAALIMLSGGARWTPGNPYGNPAPAGLSPREAGFGVLGGPHILALVSEVATRGLKIVWNQKWQVHLRLRPEAYGGLLHVQEAGALDKHGNLTKRPYGLPNWLTKSKGVQEVKKNWGGYLLPMAFTAGSPTHPAYGAGHATVAGACVTVLKAYFKTHYTDEKCVDRLVPFCSLTERDKPFGPKDRKAPFGKGSTIKAYVTGVDKNGKDTRTQLPDALASKLTLEGELNKLAANVAMGRSMGGVHWRSDNTRSLLLGEAMAAGILADITTDSNERPSFEFRSFARKSNGQPKNVRISQGRVFVDGVLVDTHSSAL